MHIFAIVLHKVVLYHGHFILFFEFYRLYYLQNNKLENDYLTGVKRMISNKKEWVLENEYFRLKLEISGKIELQAKNNPRLWISEAPFRFSYGGGERTLDLTKHCRMKVAQEKNVLKINFDHVDWWVRFDGHPYRRPDPGPEFKFRFKIELTGDEIIFTSGKIRNLDEEQCSIEFPFRLLEWDKNEKIDFIFPWGYGQMVDFPRPNEFFQHKWGYFGMPIYGVFDKNGGIGVRVLDPFDHLNLLSVGTFDSGKASIHSSWLVNKRFANYPRRIVYKYFPAGSNFVTLAKTYRNARMQEGNFVTLDEKIKQYPNVEKLVGAVIWKHAVYSQKKMPAKVKKNYSLYMLSPEIEKVEGKPDSWNAYELFNTAHKRGFDRLCVFNAGWNHCGYDSGYPKRFPVNPERGTYKDFKKAAEYARSLSKDFIYSVHDNYCDVYRNSGEDIDPTLVITHDGYPIKAGIWRGGRSWIQCSEEALKFAKRDIPKIARMLGEGSIYIDVICCDQFRECYSADHPHSRRQDNLNRRKFMKFVKSQMGSLASEAIPLDSEADIQDLGAYMSSALESEFTPTVKKAVAIPLWQLVYHDSVLCFTNAYNEYSTENYHALCALFGFLPGNLDETSLKLSKELRNAYRSEMVSFRFLTEPAEPYSYAAETCFADGTSVIANMSEKDYYDGDIKIEPHSFIIKHTSN